MAQALVDLVQRCLSAPDSNVTVADRDGGYADDQYI